jgi:hypothetical protein
MTQPSFVPITEADQVRPARHLQVPAAWTPGRPAELRTPARPIGPGMGTPGPDQGFALRLARRFAERLCLADGEASEDATVGCAVLASRRSGLFGRAPSIHDLTVAFTLWGFLSDRAPDALVAGRRVAFRSAAHDYVVQRQLTDRVPDDALRRTPEEVADWVDEGHWRVLVAPAAAPIGPGG